VVRAGPLGKLSRPNSDDRIALVRLGLAALLLAHDQTLVLICQRV
jgi:hypothetical protein